MMQRGLWGGRRRDVPAYWQRLSPEDAKLVDGFLVSLGALSTVRKDKYRTYVSKIRVEMGTPYEAVTKERLLEYVTEINESEYSEDTKRDIRQVCKRFFRWLRDDDFVKGIRLGNVEGVIGPDDVLTDLELDNLRVAARGSIRNEALLETIYELGPRPGELLGMRWSDVVFDDYGAKVTLFKRGLGTGKTQPRTIRIINAAPLLANWREHSPLRERDSPVWVDTNHPGAVDPLHKNSLAYVIGQLAELGHVEKRVNPYIFRHTRATKLAATLTEAQMCMIFGWKIGSQMPRRYIHFSMRDVDDAILSAHGLKKREVLEVPAPRRCARCAFVNPASAETCSKCGMALTLTAAMKKDEELEELKANSSRVNELIGELVRRGVIPKTSFSSKRTRKEV